jgi:glucokinase
MPNITMGEGEAQSFTCFASEGGHVEYAPRNDLEIKMYRYLSQKFMSKDRISVERVVSATILPASFHLSIKPFSKLVTNKAM